VRYAAGVRYELPDWDVVETPQLVGVLALTAVILGLYLTGDGGWTPILDDANLAFHEAGHTFYGWFGQTAALYGGVLGQLTFPLVAVAIFFVRRQPHAVVGAGVWGLQNLFNIARYMADARARELPLVGGTEHDFEHIFTRWGVLARDTQIAQITRGVAWVGLAVALTWLTWRWHRDRNPRW